MTPEALGRTLHALYVVDPAARLRADDERKAAQLAALLPVIAACAGDARPEPGLLIDAAAGRGQVALTALAHVFQGRRRWEAVCVEREPNRAKAGAEAAARLGLAARFVCADVNDPEVWTQRADIVVGLHACGGATDAILHHAAAAQARWILLLPCCYGGAQAHEGRWSPPPAQARALDLAERLGFPRQGLVRGRLSLAVVDAERTLRLEAAGYAVETSELWAPALSPFGRLWRARHVGETGRAQEARRRLNTLLAEGA